MTKAKFSLRGKLRLRWVGTRKVGFKFWVGSRSLYSYLRLSATRGSATEASIQRDPEGSLSVISP